MFALGLLIFFGAHFFTALARGLRAALVKRLGAGGYKGLYSVVSIVGFTFIIIGWDAAPADALYVTPAYFRHLTFLFTALALVLLFAAYAPAGRIAAAVRHPMLAATKLWAFGHLLANGEVRSVALFGAFLVFAVIDRIAVKARGDNGRPYKTAIGDGVAIGAGLALWAAIYFQLHPLIAGVSLR